MSNISTIKKVKRTISISMVKTEPHSNLKKMGAREGGAWKILKFSTLVTPMGIPMTVAPRIPIRRAPLTFLASRMPLIRRPMKARRTAGEPMFPNPTNTASFVTMMPARSVVEGKRAGNPS